MNPKFPSGGSVGDEAYEQVLHPVSPMYPVNPIPSAVAWVTKLTSRSGTEAVMVPLHKQSRLGLRLGLRLGIGLGLRTRVPLYKHSSLGIGLGFGLGLGLGSRVRVPIYKQSWLGLGLGLCLG